MGAFTAPAPAPVPVTVHSPDASVHPQVPTLEARYTHYFNMVNVDPTNFVAYVLNLEGHIAMLDGKTKELEKELYWLRSSISVVPNINTTPSSYPIPDPESEEVFEGRLSHILESKFEMPTYFMTRNVRSHDEGFDEAVHTPPTAADVPAIADDTRSVVSKTSTGVTRRSFTMAPTARGRRSGNSRRSRGSKDSDASSSDDHTVITSTTSRERSFPIKYKVEAPKPVEF